MKFKSVFLVLSVLGTLLGVSGTAHAADPGIQYSVFWSSPTNYRMIVLSPSPTVCSTATIRGGSGKASEVWWDTTDYYSVPCDGAQRVIDVYVSMKNCYGVFGLYVGGVQYGRTAWVYNPTTYGPGC